MSDVAFNPFEPGFFDDPYAQYAQLRDRDPVHLSPLGVWVLFRYDDCFALLRDASLSVDLANAAPTMRTAMLESLAAESAGRDHPGREPRSILNIDPPDHTRLRRLVSKAFTPRMVENLRPRVQALVDDTLDKAAANGGMDLVGDLAFPLPFTVISEMLGMPEGDRLTLRGWAHAMAKTLDPILMPDDVRAAMDAAERMTGHITDVLAWKRANPGDDLLTGMIHAEDDGDVLSEEELLDQVVLLYIAGHETTVNLIANGTLALLASPDAVSAWRAAGPQADANAVDELLRYDSPVQFSRRITTQPVEIDGHAVETGSFVMTCLGSANHDPAHWGPSAPHLDLSRPRAREHLSFGSGIHHCLGAALARLEGQVAIGTLVRRFPAMEAAGEPVRNNRIVLRGLDSLPLTLGA